MSLFLSRRKGFSSFASRLILEIFIQCSVFKVHRIPLPLRIQWRQRDSNSRPPACKAGALPTELYPHLLFSFVLDINSYPMGLSGLEPPTSRLSGVRSNRLSYKPFLLFRQPPALPCRLQHSTIGRLSLNLRVRDENGCFP